MCACRKGEEAGGPRHNTYKVRHQTSFCAPPIVSHYCVPIHASFLQEAPLEFDSPSFRLNCLRLCHAELTPSPCALSAPQVMTNFNVLHSITGAVAACGRASVGRDRPLHHPARHHRQPAGLHHRPRRGPQGGRFKFASSPIFKFKLKFVFRSTSS